MSSPVILEEEVRSRRVDSSMLDHISTSLTNCYFPPLQTSTFISFVRRWNLRLAGPVDLLVGSPSSTHLNPSISTHKLLEQINIASFTTSGLLRLCFEREEGRVRFSSPRRRKR